MPNPKIPKIIVLLDPARGYERDLLRGIWQYANRKGPWVFLRKAPHYQRFCGLRDKDLKRLGDCQADGIITPFFPELRYIAKLGLPTVLTPGIESLPGAVDLINDDRTIGEMAADHLREMGLRHFAFAGFDQLPWSLARRNGFCERLARGGWRAECHLVPFLANRRTVAREEPALVRWLRELPKPVGLMVCNDELALSISELCRIHELQVPEQIAIIGVDNDEVICELSNPPLSSIAISTQQAGYEAARLLDRLMQQKTASRTVTVAASHVVRRQSTDMTAVDDSEVAKAMTFIQQNSHRIIQVNDVAKATGLSRRSLSDRFMASFGQSISDQIHRRRVEQIMTILTTTNRSVAQIADDIGYSSDKHIARYFRRQTGITPRAYRKKHGPS
jgi:LacI family transcriptional regulator